MKKYFSKRFCWLLGLILLAGSCKDASNQMNETEKSKVNGEVTQLVGDIATGISGKGPSAWLDYFDDAPDFFMASDGELAFKDYQSAKTFILNTLVKNISKISLRWSNLNVDPFATNLASVRANFHEDITSASGSTSQIDGYFTATVRLESGKWKLLNLHWSIKKPMTFATQ